MTNIFTPKRMIHIPVHVQKTMLPFLSEKRRETFPQSIRDFADDILPEVKTLWAGIAGKRADRSLIPHARDNEDIFMNGSDIFDEGELGKDLRAQNIECVVFTGMIGPGCVLDSLRGGLREKFHCIVIPDLIADGSRESDDRNAPEDWQKRIKYLSDSLSRYEPWNLENVSFINSNEYLGSLKTKPALPATATPDSNFPQARL